MDNEKVARQITSLLDLVKEKPQTVTIEINYRDDLIAIEVEILSLNEWMKLDHEVPFPERVIARHTKDGPVYDYTHPDYQLKLRQRMARIKLKRLARCITADIPGKSNDDKADWIGDNFDEGILAAMANCLDELHSEGEATIRRIPFQHNGTATTKDHGKSKTDS